MKISLSTHQAADLLLSDSYANWSPTGALALAEYLEELEYDSGEELILDLVAIRCDFTEYKSLDDFVLQFEAAGADGQDVLEYIRDHGTLIEFDGGIIVSEF